MTVVRARRPGARALSGPVRDLLGGETSPAALFSSTCTSAKRGAEAPSILGRSPRRSTPTANRRQPAERPGTAPRGARFSPAAQVLVAGQQGEQGFQQLILDPPRQSGDKEPVVTYPTVTVARRHRGDTRRFITVPQQGVPRGEQRQRLRPEAPAGTDRRRPRIISVIR